MAVTVYLEGQLSSDRKKIYLPLSSAALLLVSSYTCPQAFSFVFVSLKEDDDDDDVQSKYVSLSTAGVDSLQHEFINADSLPTLARNMKLPCVLDESERMVRGGLCVLVRHIVRVAHATAEDQHLSDLLGFRQGSLRMCAEVSGWTKLCEVDLPDSITTLIHNIRQATSEPEDEMEIIVPMDLIKLEAHFKKPPKVHNDDRIRRKEIADLHLDLSKLECCTELLRHAKIEDEKVVFERVTEVSHGCRKIVIERTMIPAVSTNINKCCNGQRLQQDFTAENVKDSLLSATYLDVQLVHLYSEGIEMTVADLCLFTYLYFLMETLDFNLSDIPRHLPHVIGWLKHMITLPRLQRAALQCGLAFDRLRERLLNQCPKERSQCRLLTFVRSSIQPLSEDEMELSRRCRSKHRAIKPEVVEAVNKLKKLGIDPVLGSHPRGIDVGLGWDKFPDYVHPKEGEVPHKRVERKCQQLQNLVTAVVALARAGDVIVDFCSGGGHLGIAIAHLLPQCNVYLVENKEESLAKAQSRLREMNSDNLFLYQCNLDYFVGKFDVGVSLHACGSATDMVLQQCLTSKADFVICPCCYGGIQRTHFLSYPQSCLYREKGITYTEFITLGHAADQTEFNIALEQQGRHCMNLVDFDRLLLAKEAGYSVTLTSLQPLTCSPKNNLLIGRLLKLPCEI